MFDNLTLFETPEKFLGGIAVIVLTVSAIIYIFFGRK